MFTSSHWYGVSKRDPRVVDLYRRHYSSIKSRKTVLDWLAYGIAGPGNSITLITPEGAALFVWIRMKYRNDGQAGINCAVFRNEAPEQYLSSELIREAESLAWAQWTGERLFTYVDGRAVHGDGCCFKRAGWTKLKQRSRNGLIILEKLSSQGEAA